MEESNEIYEKVVSILEEGVKPLEKLYEKKGVVFSPADVKTIAEVFRDLNIKMLLCHKEITRDGVLKQIIKMEGDCAGIACYECPLCVVYDCVDVERSTNEILEKALEVRNGKD